MKKITNGLALIILLFSTCTTLNTKDVEPVNQDGTILGHISNINAENKSFDFDEAEWITVSDIEKINELGIDVDNDMPGGFYVYNLKNGIKTFTFSSNTVFIVLDREDNWHSYKTLDLNGFVAFLNENDYGTGLWIISFNNNSVVEIKEAYLP